MTTKNGKTRLFAQRSFHQTKPSTDKDFSVVTYNTLADAALLKSPAYEYCEKKFKERFAGSHRHELLLLEELEWLNGDILCLQEVDGSYFDNLLHQSLAKLGYCGHSAIYDNMYGYGVATFFKTDIFELVAKKQVSIYDARMKEVCKEENQEALLDYLQIPTKVLMSVLRHKASNQLLLIGNVHITFDWYGHPVRQLLEICCATKILHEFKESLRVDHSKQDKIPHIFCGDFNVEPHHPGYKVLTSGGLDKEDLKTLETTKYIRYYESVWSPTPEIKISEKERAILNHLNKYFVNSLKTVKSTYKTVLGREPEVSNHEGGNDHWTLDYLWYSSDSLSPVGALDVVPLSVIQNVVGLPNEFFPSDHLSLKAFYHFLA